MISKDMLSLGTRRSSIRELFEYGRKRKAEIGKENVFDFSLGNPNVPPPPEVKEAIFELLEERSELELHGYTSAQGDAEVRATIAESLNSRFDVEFSPDNIYMSTGAAASLCISLKALVVTGNNIIGFAPFFPEYKVFAEATGAAFKPLQPDPKNLQIDTQTLENTIDRHTKAIILNSPNNPSGVVYSEATILEVCRVLAKKSAEYGHTIYIISDEPYRELVYDGVKVPFLVKYYKDTIMCYSYSKSLSLPGERIGYIAVSPYMQNSSEVYAAICGAGRALGYVCAPSLFQRVAARCEGKTSDINIYKNNRDLLYDSLTSYGYQCVKPDGAFYLFIKSMEEDAKAFCERAKKHELLLVAGDDFGCPGYARVAYCVPTEQITNALPAFKSLAEDYNIS
ncbi:MAG: pyridoxal phosphate-dependent aminotransferase [Clostridia bacterium]